MELVERDHFLTLLQTRLENIQAGEGHSIFISGEAGIGKTSLVKTFVEQNKVGWIIYQGSCDALFTPRPLAPLYDIMWQLKSSLWPEIHTIKERSELYAKFLRSLSDQKQKMIIVFEDIHWADEATLDFIRFFGRRVSQLGCLFILTYRDDEIHMQHGLKYVLGQLPPDSFSRIKLTALSRAAVEKMAMKSKYSGEDVHTISGGNPFYVNEILANYSPGIPENIKDSILSVYNRQDITIKQLWDFLSIMPGGFDIKYLNKTGTDYSHPLQFSLETKILIMKGTGLFFKHELYRRTIEASLSPLTRVKLNKNILTLFLSAGDQNIGIEQIVHHAKNANEYDTVVQYAPLAAVQAASVGAHTEACRLYLASIEYYQGNDTDTRIKLYEGYAYESYLTNQGKEAIIYTRKALLLWKEKNNIGKIGNSFRFLSRLWWFEGDKKKAEDFALQAVSTMESQPSSAVKAMVYSNMSLLKLLSDEADECKFWGEQAIAIAKEVNDQETLVHALTNVGGILMLSHSSMKKGITILEETLALALDRSDHEQAARILSLVGCCAVIMKEYRLAGQKLAEGIEYCEERDLDFLKLYLLSWTARLKLETGHWDEAYRMAENLLNNGNQPTIGKIVSLGVLSTIKMRRGDNDALPLLLEVKEMAFAALELQRIIPALVALLEYEWITGKTIIPGEDIYRTLLMIEKSANNIEKSEFAFFLWRARKQHLHITERYDGYDMSTRSKATSAAVLWGKSCPYMQAIALFEGGDDEKRKAIKIVQDLGANAVFDKMKQQMRAGGIKNIPRGINRATRANTAFLTTRELDILQLLKEGLQNKEIASRLFISAKTVDHHISSIFFKLNVNSRIKAVAEAARQEI